MGSKAYLPKLCPKVGKGLGGLPSRKVESSSNIDLTTSTKIKRYKFTKKSSSGGSYSPVFTHGLYFDDNNIFSLTGGSTIYKTTLNRNSMTLGSVTQTGTINGVTQSPGLCSILVSSTVVASASSNIKVTLSGTTLTTAYIVPLTGTHTVGGTSYSLASDIGRLRKIPDSSNYALICKDISNAGLRHIFILDNTLQIIKSGVVTSTNSYYHNFHIVKNKICSISASGNNYFAEVIDIDTFTVVYNRLTISPPSIGGTIASVYFLGTSFDKERNRIFAHIIFHTTTAGVAFTPSIEILDNTDFLNFKDESALSTGTAEYNINLNNTINSTLLNIAGSNSGSMTSLFGLKSNAYIYPLVNEYGNNAIFLTANNGYPCATYINEYSFEHSNFSYSGMSNTYTFSDNNYSNKSFYALATVLRNDRNIFFDMNDYGFYNAELASPFPIGDNLFLSIGQRGQGDSYCYFKLFLKEEL